MIILNIFCEVSCFSFMLIIFPSIKNTLKSEPIMLIRKQQSETEENASRVLVCSVPNEAISGVTPEQCGARPLTSVITQTSARVGNVWQCLAMSAVTPASVWS